MRQDGGIRYAVCAELQVKIGCAGATGGLIETELNVLEPNRRDMKLPEITRSPMIRVERVGGAISDRDCKTRQVGAVGIMKPAPIAAADIWLKPRDGSPSDRRGDMHLKSP